MARVHVAHDAEDHVGARLEVVEDVEQLRAAVVRHARLRSHARAAPTRSMSLLAVSTARSPFADHSHSAWLQFSTRCCRRMTKCGLGSFGSFGSFEWSAKNATTPSPSFSGENSTN